MCAPVFPCSRSSDWADTQVRPYISNPMDQGFLNSPEEGVSAAEEKHVGSQFLAPRSKLTPETFPKEQSGLPFPP